MLAQVDRDRIIQDEIEGLLYLESMRSVMMTAYRQQPSFLLRILDTVNSREPEPVPSSRDKPTWCRCNNCRDMPSEVEKRCCNQLPQNCHSILPDFNHVVLDPLVLEVAMRYRNDLLAQPPDQDFNRCHRHTAYRQYILLTWEMETDKLYQVAVFGLSETNTQTQLVSM